MSVHEKMTAIADAIRIMTGGTEPLTLDQMPGEISSISGGGATGIYMAQVTPASDLSELVVTHNLGTSDILMAVCFAEDYPYSEIPFNAATMGKMWLKPEKPVYLSGTVKSTFFEAHLYYTVSSGYYRGGQTTNTPYMSYVLDGNNFAFARHSSVGGFPAGVTYSVIIVAGNAEV